LGPDQNNEKGDVGDEHEQVPGPDVGAGMDGSPEDGLAQAVIVVEELGVVELGVRVLVFPIEKV
jgi:hypothetical protein